MIQNHCLFPIYDHIDQQFRFRSNCENREVNTFKFPNNILPPFFFTRTKRLNTIVQLSIMPASNTTGTGSGLVDIDILNGTPLQIISTPTYDGFGNPARIIRTESGYNENGGWDPYSLPCGLYYLRLREFNFNAETLEGVYFSEVFEAVEVDGIATTDLVELIKNGTFTTDLSNWGITGSWAVASGKAQYAGTGTGNILAQTLSNVPTHYGQYKVTLTISDYADAGDSTRYLQIFADGTNAANSLIVTDNGTYEFYVDAVSQFAVQHPNGEVTFDIDNVSIQAVTGYGSEYVTILAAKNCKFPNNIAPNDFFYTNILLLDAKILAPQYGEDSVENENGRFENLITFVRSFKTHSITPLLLPEPVVDAIAQLNTFDICTIFNGETGEKWTLSASDDAESALKERSFIRFNITPEWQDGECYALVSINFEENLSLKNGCCDVSEVTPCFDETDTVTISVTPGNNSVHIALSNSPTGFDAAFVEIWISTQDAGSFTNCNSMPAPTNTGITMTFQDFADNGINYIIPDLTEKVYKAYIKITQIGCGDEKTTDAVCSNAYELELVSVVDACDGADSELTVTTNITNYTLVVIEFWDNDNSQWIQPTLVVDGANTPFTISFASELAITKARLRAPNGDLSDELALTLTVCE